MGCSQNESLMNSIILLLAYLQIVYLILQQYYYQHLHCTYLNMQTPILHSNIEYFINKIKKLHRTLYLHIPFICVKYSKRIIHLLFIIKKNIKLYEDTVLTLIRCSNGGVKELVRHFVTFEELFDFWHKSV